MKLDVSDNIKKQLQFVSYELAKCFTNGKVKFQVDVIDNGIKKDCKIKIIEIDI